MVRPLSEHLAELSARAKHAEESADRARTEGEARLRIRLDEIRAEATSRADSVESDMKSKWAELRDRVRAEVDGLRADIDERRYEHDVKREEKRAERAEEHAAAAILFAMDAIDHAEVAAIDAVIARAAADEAKG